MTIFPRWLSTLTLILLLIVTPVAFAKGKNPWTQFRGTSAEGPSAAGDLPGTDFGLALAWSRDLGSGYSNVWIAKDKAVTMFAAGEVDVVAAFDLASGDEVWRYELGEKYAGHDGSDDGPIGTPPSTGAWSTPWARTGCSWRWLSPTGRRAGAAS